jgi:hypothetical protein
MKQQTRPHFQHRLEMRLTDGVLGDQPRSSEAESA